MGFTFLSIGCLLFFIPSLPEIINSVHFKEKIKLDDPTLNDKASGIYNSFYFLGSIIAPILGGMLNDHIGFRSTNDVMMAIGLTFTVIYFLFFFLSKTKK